MYNPRLDRHEPRHTLSQREDFDSNSNSFWDPYRDLACAVIGQAFNDLVGTNTLGERVKLREEARRDAERFLCDAADLGLDFWCNYAGNQLDPVAIRERCVSLRDKRLSGEKTHIALCRVLRYGARNKKKERIISK